VLDRIDALILAIPVVWYYWILIYSPDRRSTGLLAADGEGGKAAASAALHKGLLETAIHFGSTGSIGRQCLSVVEALPERFGVVALAAGANLEELIGQIERHRPEVVSVGDAKRADELSRLLRERGISPLPEIHHDREGMLVVGTHPKADIVVSAAVGVVGLEATYEAVKLGKTVALSKRRF